MKRLLQTCVLLVSVLGVPASVSAQDASPVVRAMRDELGRSMQELRLPGMAGPYYLGYAVSDVVHEHLTAAHGAAVLREDQKFRTLEVSLRVGSHELDSSEGGGSHQAWLPIDDDYHALRRALWIATDDAYKHATEGLERKRAAQAAATPDERSDFSKEEARESREPAAPAPALLASHEPRVLEASRVFGEFPAIHGGYVELSSVLVLRRMISSEGAYVQQSEPLARIDVVAQTQADDGMTLSHFASFTASSGEGLPSAAQLVETTRRVCRELLSQRAAPVLDKPYRGPVLFEGLAAAQVTRALLVPVLGGTPPPRFAMGYPENELADRVGRDVLPAAFSVIDDPLLAVHDGVPLVGHYAVDDEGIAAQRVTLIERGVLKTLLMSRTPSKDLVRSNGHGRGALGGARAMIANLLVQAKGGEGAAGLRKRLLAEAKKAGEPFGIVIRVLAEPSVTGLGSSRGFFSRLGRGGALLPEPIQAVRVYPDGREEPVRGLAVGDVNLGKLRDVVAWSRQARVFNFGDTHVQARAASASMPGPFSGLVLAMPSSMVVQDLLFRELEIDKASGENDKLPLYPQPLAQAAPPK